ncbi:TPA: hypothetical protein ACMUVF_002962, partial [Enterococcus faecium]
KRYGDLLILKIIQLTVSLLENGIVIRLNKRIAKALLSKDSLTSQHLIKLNFGGSCCPINF